MRTSFLAKSRTRATAVATAVAVILALMLVPMARADIRPAATGPVDIGPGAAGPADIGPGAVGPARARGPATLRGTHVRISGTLSATGAGLVDVAAVLADENDQGAPMPGRALTFTLGAQTATATTDSQGVARAQLTFTAGAAATVTARFAGDALYAASADTALFNPVSLFPTLPVLNHSQSRYIALAPNATGLVNNGGALPTANFSGGYAPVFLNLDPLRIADAARANPLGGFDTLILNGICDIGASRWLGNATFRSRLQAFALDGGKLVIYDSECTNTDYSRFFLPFTANTPGAAGATGVLQIAEQNSLSNSTPASPSYIDAAKIATNTDAVGDANVFVSYDPNWCVALLARNSRLPELKPTHTYALIGQGIAIYNGLDKDNMSSQALLNPGTGPYYLSKLFELELKQPWNPSGLPCEQSVAPATISLSPPSAVHDVGQSHSVTATVIDGAGQPLTGVFVTLQVTGANPSSLTATTNASGSATFTYTGAHAGTDNLVVQAGAIHSNGATATWNEVGPCQLVWLNPPNGGTPFDVAIGGTVTLRFSYGDCHRFIHDESVIVNVEHPDMSTPPVTTWVYGYDITIDDAAREYRVNFTPGRYGLTVGTTYPVTVYMSGQLVGQASVRLTP